MNTILSKRIFRCWLSKIIGLTYLLIMLGSSVIYAMNYGDIVRFKHNATRPPAMGYLAARSEPCTDPVSAAAGGKVVVVAQSTMAFDTDWIVGGSKPQGSPVNAGDVITLQARAQNYYLANKDRALSQATKKGGVFGQPSPNEFSNWIVSYPANGQIALRNQSTGGSLSSQQGVNFQLGSYARTEVCTTAYGPLAIWIVELTQAATPAPAAPVTPPAPVPVATPAPVPAAPAPVPAPVISGTGFLWGVNGAHNIFFKNGITDSNPKGGDWVSAEGLLKQIAVGPNGQVWGVNAADDIWMRNNVTPSNLFGSGWTQIPGKLIHLSVGLNGVVWGVNAAGNIFMRAGVTASNPQGTSWVGVDGALVNISVGLNGQVWGTNSTNDIYFREGITDSTPQGTSWTHIPGKLSQVAVGPNGLAWALGGGIIYFRTGITAANPRGSSFAPGQAWKTIPGPLLSYISIGHTGQVWGVGPTGIFFRAGVTPATPEGTAWESVPGALIGVAAGATSPTTGTLQVAPPPPAGAPAPAAPVTPPAPVTKAVVAPEDFEEEVGMADSIAVGSRNNDLEAWRVDADGKLYRFDKYSLAVDPWIVMDAKLADGSALAMPLEWITVSSDGVMCVLDHNGKAFMYDWDKKVFNKMIDGTGNEALTLEFISAGNKDNIWAVDGKNRNILQYTSSGWSAVQKGEAVYVTAAADGTVIALNEVGEVYSYLGDGKWDDLPGVRLARVAAAGANNVWGVGTDGALYTYSDNVGSRTTAVMPAQPVAIAPDTGTATQGKVNKWKKGAKKRAKKAVAKKGKKAGKKASKKAAKKKAQAAGTTAANQPATPTTPSAPLQTQATQASGNKWVRVKGKAGAATSGFADIAINAAGTIFAIDVNHAVYHKGDAGFSITKVTAGKVEGTPAPDAQKKMTRRQAKKAGKLDIAGSKKKVGKGKKNPLKKKKSRVVQRKKMKKPTKKTPMNKPAVKK